MEKYYKLSAKEIVDYYTPHGRGVARVFLQDIIIDLSNGPGNVNVIKVDSDDILGFTTDLYHTLAWCAGKSV